MDRVKQYQDIDINSRVLGASPYELTELLIKRGLTDIHNAIAALEQNDIESKCRYITHAHDVVTQLHNGLYEEIDPKRYQQLDGIYTRIGLQLLKANLSNDNTLLRDCEEQLNGIARWWKTIGDILKSEDVLPPE